MSKHRGVELPMVVVALSRLKAKSTSLKSRIKLAGVLTAWRIRLFGFYFSLGYMSVAAYLAA